MAESNLAERLKRVIAELGVSQAEFARSVGVTRNYIYCLTGGRKHSCSRSLALLIEEKYGYPANWLMRGQEAEKDLAKEIAEKTKSLDPEALKAVSEYIDRIRGAGG
jgi:transcriptional regulator with XRE-family HTH domain